jgi:hypothetical protein
MAVPKAAMNQHRCIILGKHEIGLSREIGNVYPTVQRGSPLGLSTFERSRSTLDATNIPTACSIISISLGFGTLP